MNIRQHLPGEFPKIITLCGSTRFIEQFAIMAWEMEKQGAIVLGLHYLPPSYFEAIGEEPYHSHGAEHEGVAEHFDNLHKRKIDISDAIYVLNVGGYIGDSTRAEIAYAEFTGKPVSYLEELGEVTE